jgi:hypothetical protein
MKKLLAVLMLCGCSTIARTQYGLQLDQCVDDAKSRAEADKCIHDVQLRWDEAGAPPALVVDAGAE